MSFKNGSRISKFIQDKCLHNVLELGFAHGVSTCYIAAAVKTNGGGTVTTIDLESACNLEPNIHALLDRCVLSEIVNIYFEARSFTWRLMKMLEDAKSPRFDLIYLDGGHSWDVTGFAFFLVDRLLVPGGWLIFDDIDWTYSNSPKLCNSRYVEEMPEDYKKTPQIRKVFELLVSKHQDYTSFSIEDDWGFAQKEKKD